ncbi:MAG: hypothetical protein EA392_11100 [Cryomorphaceae bacterium]|nr:MAG: hypothetical protein EA392_11100 [Cryomorphaceae bacterium]
MANKRSLYWVMQLSGWLVYILILALWTVLTGQFELPVLKVWATVFTVGIVTSHGFRAIVLVFHWLRFRFYHAIWRLFLMSVLLGFAAASLHAVVSDLFFPEIKRLVAWPFFDLVQLTLAYAPQLFIWSLLYFAWNYLRNYEREEVKNLRLEASKREIELSNLKSQLNPHFMFNAMNSIRALIDENPELAKKSLTQLSAILRNTLMVGKQPLVPLENELRVVRNYLDLERIRYEERLEVSFDIDDSLFNVLIPPLMLQTLVENAVKHGISQLVKGGQIKLAARQQGDGFYISVSNTGVLNSTESADTGIGLANTRKRLALLFGDDARFQIQQSADGVEARIEFFNRKTIHPYENIDH